MRATVMRLRRELVVVIAPGFATPSFGSVARAHPFSRRDQVEGL